MRVLVANAGSSSVKLSLLDDDHLILSEETDGLEPGGDATAVRSALERMPDCDVVGHRLVHGGDRREAARLDADLLEELSSLRALAPLHQPRAVALMHVVEAVLPAVPAVACFDTAFHTSIPAAAATYALPAEWRRRWDLRRFGFHGISHAYVADRAAEVVGRPATDLRIVSCHLGAGASLCAIQGGVSVDTTMGFTPLEGLVMATRSGSVDPGLLLWLLADERLSQAELEAGLERESGLLGLAGTADMRSVLELASAGNAEAMLGRDVYVHRLQAAVGAMAAALNGLDVLVFTGGVGENAPLIRSEAARRLGHLGVGLDEEANGGLEPDREIGDPQASVRTLVIKAREDLEIARQTRHVITDQNG